MAHGPDSAYRAISFGPQGSWGAQEFRSGQDRTQGHRPPLGTAFSSRGEGLAVFTQRCLPCRAATCSTAPTSESSLGGGVSLTPLALCTGPGLWRPRFIYQLCLIFPMEHITYSTLCLLSLNSGNDNTSFIYLGCE